MFVSKDTRRVMTFQIQAIANSHVTKAQGQTSPKCYHLQGGGHITHISTMLYHNLISSYFRLYAIFYHGQKSPGDKLSVSPKYNQSERRIDGLINCRHMVMPARIDIYPRLGRSR